MTRVEFFRDLKRKNLDTDRKNWCLQFLFRNLLLEDNEKSSHYSRHPVDVDPKA